VKNIFGFLMIALFLTLLAGCKASADMAQPTWQSPDQGLDDHDHLISPEERWRVAMARQ
jgi:hypothetical protein